MRILMFSSLKKGKGGAEVAFERISQGIEEEGATILRLYKDSELPAGRIQSDGEDGRANLSVPLSWKALFNPIHLWRALRSFLEVIKITYKFKPDIVYYYFLNISIIYFAIAKKIQNFRLINTCQGSDAKGFHTMKKRVCKFSLENVDEIVCVSKALSVKLKEELSLQREVKVIHNAVDERFFGKNGGETKEKNVGTIISVGALRRVKGHDVLIRAFYQIVEDYPGIRLLIVGDGPEREKYEELVKHLGLENTIEITGWLPPEEVRKYMAAASLFVFPSRWEGFGIALVEAMAVGLPLVASKVGGIPEVADDDGALFFNPGSSSSLAEKLSIAIEDHNWRMAASCYNSERAKKFRWERIVKKYVNLFKKNG